MADVKISALLNLGAAPNPADYVPIVDVSATATKRVTIADLFTSPNVTGTLTADGLTVDTTTPVIDVLSATNDDATLILRESGIGVVGAELVYDGGDNAFYVKVGNNSSTKRLAIARDTGDISFYEDTGTTAKFFWDASAESLGIGTSSPVDTGAAYGDLTINGTSGAFISLQSNGSTTGVLQTIGTETRLSTSVASGYLAFRTSTGVSGTEAMRLDSSGNVLVGTTSASNTTAGIRLYSGGNIGAASAGVPLELNRLSTDGNVLVLKKNGATVGNLGSILGQYLSVGTGDTGFAFDDDLDKIIPWNTTANTANDAAVDLGGSSQRFKDLYLSGGVVFGSTGGAVTSKTLDDYEEGTFTAELKVGTTVMATTTACNYTKVGKLVHISMDFANNAVAAVGAATGSVTITGLPFVALGEGRQTLPSPFSLGSVFPAIALGNVIPNISVATSFIAFAEGSGSFITALDETDFTATGIPSGSYFRISGTYESA